jgi:4'-phosphopantetheinyl transferase
MRDDAVQLSRIVPEATPDPAALAILDDEERARGAGFAKEDDRRRFQRVRAELRRRVAAATGVAPAQVRFRANPWGKPEVDGVHVNASHAQGLALVALTHAGQVGVDVERVERTTRADELDLARRFFTPAEAAALEATGEVDRPRAFLRLWTRKEAALKAWGRGVSGGLERVDVRAVGPVWSKVHIDGFGPVWVTDLDVGEAHLAALSIVAEAPPPIAWLDPLT